MDNAEAGIRARGIAPALLIWRDNELNFAVAEQDGTISRTGKFPEQAPPASLSVVADYSLLSAQALFAAGMPTQIELIPPESRPLTQAPETSATQLARRWAGIPDSRRARVSTSEVERLDAFLELRREVAAMALEETVRLYGFLERTFPNYAQTLAPDARLDAAAFALLRAYPVPTELFAENPYRLHNIASAIFQGNERARVAQVMRYQAAADGPSLPMHRQAAARYRIISELQNIELHQRQRVDVDEQIFQLAYSRFEVQKPSPDRQDGHGSELPWGWGDFLDADGGAAPLSLAEVLEELEKLGRKSLSGAREPDLDLETFEMLYRAFAEQAEPLEAGYSDLAAALKRNLDVEVLGQKITVAAGDFPGTARHRAATRGLTANAASQELDPRTRIDAEIVSAVTGLLTSNVQLGFPDLVKVVQDPLFGHADPALAREANGLVAMTLMLLGQTKQVALLLDSMPVPDRKEASPAWAAVSITRLLFEGSNPETDDETVGELVRWADSCSDRSGYRTYFNLVMMYLSYATKDHDSAQRGYTEIIRDGAWEKYSPALFAQVELARAFHLTSVGEFGAARQKLDAVREPDRFEGTDMVRGQRDLFKLYLSAAAGDYEKILDVTEDGARFGAGTLERSKTGVRYLPAALLLRGTALVKDGAVARGQRLFRKATLAAIETQDWVVLLCGETDEYRSWLAGLEESELPQGLSPEARARILGRPLYLSHSLPVLTKQQKRVLQSLALGRSTAAISHELHISSNTLKTHLRRLYSRLGVANRKEAVVLAEGYGLLD